MPDVDALAALVAVAENLNQVNRILGLRECRISDDGTGTYIVG
jgi:hypothetical protein